MKNFLLVLLCINIYTNGFSQQLFQDASGNTNISLGTNSLAYIFYNTSDKSASLGYTHNNNTKNEGGYDWTSQEADFIFGGELKIKTKNGIGNIFTKEAFNPGFSLSGNFGLFKDNFLDDGHYLNLFVRPQISYNQYPIIGTQSLVYTITNVKKVESAFLVNFNIQFNNSGYKVVDGQSVTDTTKKNYVFLFIQSGFKQANNYDDLNDGQITNLISQSGLKSIETIETGKLGEFDLSNTLPLDVDLAVTPRIFNNNYIGFNSYYRTNFFKKINTSKAGVGVYLADPKRPSQISGGIGWQFNDLYNTLGKDNSLIDRSSIFFYVGFAIGSK